MNLISFANYTQPDNQTSFLQANEKDDKPEDFSSILSNISVALQTTNSPVLKISGGFKSNSFPFQTVSENGQSFVLGNNQISTFNPFNQSPALLPNSENTASNQTNLSQPILPASSNPIVSNTATAFKTETAISFSPSDNLITIPANFQPVPNLPTMQNFGTGASVGENLNANPQIAVQNNQTVSLEPIVNSKDFEILSVERGSFVSPEQNFPITRLVSSEPTNNLLQVFKNVSNSIRESVLPQQNTPQTDGVLPQDLSIKPEESQPQATAPIDSMSEKSNSGLKIKPNFQQEIENLVNSDAKPKVNLNFDPQVESSSNANPEIYVTPLDIKIKPISPVNPNESNIDSSLDVVSEFTKTSLNEVKPETKPSQPNPLNIDAQPNSQTVLNSSIETSISNKKTIEAQSSTPEIKSIKESPIKPTETKPIEGKTTQIQASIIETKSVVEKPIQHHSSTNENQSNVNGNIVSSDSKVDKPKLENYLINNDSQSPISNQVVPNSNPSNSTLPQSQNVSVGEQTETKNIVKVENTGVSINSESLGNTTPEKKVNSKEEENDFSQTFDNAVGINNKEPKITETTLKSQFEPAKIAEQINPHLLELAKLAGKKNEKETLKMRLNPAELGTVEITLERTSSGVMNAHFKTETEGAKQALSNSLEQLRESLQNAGIEVGTLDISNGSSSSTNEQFRENTQRKSEPTETFVSNRNSEQPDETETSSPARLLNMLA